MKSPHLIDFPNPGCWIMHDGWKEKIHSQTTLTTHTHSRLRFFTYARSRAIFNMLSPKLDGAVGAKSASSCSSSTRGEIGGKSQPTDATPRHVEIPMLCCSTMINCIFPSGNDDAHTWPTMIESGCGVMWLRGGGVALEYKLNWKLHMCGRLLRCEKKSFFFASIVSHANLAECTS